MRRLPSLLLCALLAAASFATLAQTAPAGPVTLIVPYPAGGPSDVTARIVGPAVARRLQTEVIVENIGGATGGIAIQKMLSAAADGRLLYQGSQNELIIPPMTVKSVRYQPTDLEIIHPITTTRLVLVIRKGLPVKDLAEFVAYTKSSPTPLSYGSPGVGSLYHLIPERMAKLTGTKYNHIPYKGTAPMMQDLIGDRLDFGVIAFTPSLIASVQAGHYRIIANMSRDKPKELASLPSASDIEAFKTVDYASNAGYFVRKGTPVALKTQLNRALGEAFDGAVATQLEADGRLVHRRMSLADAEAFYKTEIAKYERIIAETGFQPLD